MNDEYGPPNGIRRAAVVGTSCSGKTTFARALAARLGAKHVELDALNWLPDWNERPEPELRALTERETADPRWVADGNYAIVRDIVWGRASDVIWLNYPFPVVFSRAVRRTVRRASTGETLFGGNRETFRQSFLSRDSILLWVLTTHRKNRRAYTAARGSGEWRHLRFTELRHPDEAVAFLARIRPDPSAHRAAAST